MLLKNITIFAVGKRMASWTMSPRLVPVQIFPVHMMHFLGDMYEAVLLLEIPCIFLLKWS